MAKERNLIGNPPGKSGSIGDSLNWCTILARGSVGDDLCIVSGDGDYYSALNPAEPAQFLVDEWQTKKAGQLKAYRTLRQFLKVKIPEIKIRDDENQKRKILINQLAESASFASTHSIISQLTKYAEFDRDDYTAIARACLNNNQIRWIASDDDVKEFIERIWLRMADDLPDELSKEFDDAFAPF